MAEGIVEGDGHDRRADAVRRHQDLQSVRTVKVAALPGADANAVFLDAEITACKAEPVDAEKPDGLQTLYITIDAAAATANNVYKVASQEIRAGYEYNVKTPLFELAGVICELEVRNG